MQRRPAALLNEDPGTPGLAWFEIHHAQGTEAHAIRDLTKSIMVDRIVGFGNHHNDHLDRSVRPTGDGPQRALRSDAW